MDFSAITDKLRNLGYKVSEFETARDAAEYLGKEIKNKTVGFGGSITLEQMKLYEILSKSNTVYWHQRISGGAPDTKIRQLANSADIYISSVNALAKTGEIVNIDGNCNRVASLLYGREKVYLVIGRNKIRETYEEALFRARNIAAPLNAKRVGAKTPCAVKADKCYDCNSSQRICRGLCVLWAPPMTGEYVILLINEDLGY